ncbi:MAG TPA: hypothetical protein VFJ52_03735 [Terriglobia bacterium]|nr:hypothetical protein [Terriglobia bacterium]
MKRLKLIGAVTIILSVATMLCLIKVMRAQEAASKTITVTITPNPTGPPTVDPESVDVYKDQNEQVEWKCDDQHPNCDFTVTFPTSHAKPFNDSTFSKAHPNSGVPTGPPGKYPYNVKVGHGSTDPQIIVH